MTEWDAANYARRSSLQESMAAEVLALLHLTGNERVLDIGCGDGRITAEIAARLPNGSVLGVDFSQHMIDFATQQHCAVPNLKFQTANAANFPFRHEFDFIVSFNALHWLPNPDPPLQSVRAAMKSTAQAQLRVVPDGERKSLETVLEETRKSSRWSSYYDNFHDPYLHLTPDQYAAAAQRNGLRVQRLHTSSHSWDFQSREDFFAFGQVTFVEWTRRLPNQEIPAFINDVLDRYAAATASSPAEQNSFKFYQLDVTLSPA